MRGQEMVFFFLEDSMRNFPLDRHHFLFVVVVVVVMLSTGV
jgi:hypothetical protein